MKIGRNQGDCVVFAERNNGGLNESKIGPDQIDITNQYMMALALEYKLLSRGSQDTHETIYELFHLLWTINRLDLEMEQYMDVGPNSEISAYDRPLNGFMLREDAPLNYVSSNLDHFNYERLLGNPNGKSFTGLDNINQLSLDNKFSGWFHNTGEEWNLCLPHDKYHSMLVALMFIVKYIPDQTGYYEIVNGQPQLQYFRDNVWDIKQEAKEIAKRIYKYCRGNNDLWILKLLNSQETDLGNIPVGKDAWIYSWPLSIMTCHVENGYPFTESNQYCVSNNWLGTYAGASGWQYYVGLCNNNPGSEDNAVFVGWDEAGSNISPPGVPIWFLMQPTTAAYHTEWSELLRKVLHQNGVLVRQCKLPCS